MFGWGFIAEPQKFLLTPFLRSLLVSEKMKALKTLQEQCPAYLGLGEKLEELRVLGTARDLGARLVRVLSLCEAL